MNNDTINTKEVIIGLIQNRVGPDVARNVAATVKMAERATKKGAQIICLQELYNTPYFPQYQTIRDKDGYAEHIPGVSTAAFAKVARTYGVVIIVPVFEKSGPAGPKAGQKQGGTYYNSAAVIDERGRLREEVYRKIHLPQDPGFYEKNYFKAGDGGYKIFKTKFATFAVLICYDQWYPEAARACRLAGAEIIFYPTAIGDIIGYRHKEDWHQAWETIQRGHAIANSVYVASVNRVGREGRMRFFGQSFISNPWGEVLARASKHKAEVLVQKIDLAYNKFFSDGWGFLRNRRPDTYQILLTRKFVDKSNKLKNVAHYKTEREALAGK